MVKKNQIDGRGIIVRTGKTAEQRKNIIGKIYKIIGNYSDRSMELWGGWTISREHARLATADEIEAYNEGARHISEIKSKVVDNYSII